METVDRLNLLENKVNILEQIIKNRIGTINTVEQNGLYWINVSSEEINDAIIEAITSMYIGRNYEGFRDHVHGQFPANVLLLGENGDVSRPAAAIIIKKHPCGWHIKLNVHKYRNLVHSHIMPKYIELLSDKTNNYFTEISSGVLEEGLRNNGIQNISDSNTIAFIAQVGQTRIITDECDQRCRMHPLSNGDPCTIGSYITQSGKRMALYGNPRVSD